MATRGRTGTNAPSIMLKLAAKASSRCGSSNEDRIHGIAVAPGLTQSLSHRKATSWSLSEPLSEPLSLQSHEVEPRWVHIGYRGLCEDTCSYANDGACGM